MRLIFDNQDKISKVSRENGIVFLGLFGSFARGEGKDGSDIDLLAEFDKQKGLFDLIRIEKEFERVFGKKVDLVTQNSLSPHLRENVINSLKILYDERR